MAFLKKTLFIGMTVGTAVIVAACGDSATVTDNASKKSDLTLEQVYEKTIERQQELESMKAKMKVDQAINVDSEEGSFEMTSASDLNMDMIIDPMQLYVEGTTAVKESETGEETKVPTKMYMTQNDGYYLYEESADSWFKLPEEQFDAMMSQAGIQQDPSEQLRQLEKFVEDFTFEQNDDEYILTLNADGEKFMDFVLQQAKEALGGEEAAQALGSMEGLKIKDAQYVFLIDKKTFDMNNMKMDMIITLEEEDGKMTIDQSATVDYSDFNNVDAITIPQEVIDNAQVLQ
ncbi:hypothetical protein CD32_19615 [Lysinibacillus odysseyi 34hs-1 = NBRC 100172]|uniref:Lipoprotein n=1 Tax=Lysinibacillus odysseyi 34hs-1 = NBRC 100172 TaxID=1220589 RepID=A0A0A3IA10_9BACI|nr:hypothetical protein CD32_19615 [Lysinibacillus odysseyi 34hs-1 = NBRC 100172]